jgi:hypothetical protein
MSDNDQFDPNEPKEILPDGVAPDANASTAESDDTEQPTVKKTQDVSLDQAMAAKAKRPSRFQKQDIEKFIKYGFAAGALLLVVLMVYSCQPRKGPMGYGICSTFLEVNTVYPHTLHHTDVEFSNTAVRIYFSNIDAFGEFKHEMIECTFGPDEKMGMKLTDVKRNRRSVDSKLVRDFNLTLPTVMSSEPYLVLPPEWKNPLSDE